MEKISVQNAAEYVVNLESGLYYWTGTLEQWINELPTLHELIDSIHFAAFESDDSTEKAFLKRLHSKACNCRECILKRIGGRNLPVRNSRLAESLFHYHTDNIVS